MRFDGVRRTAHRTQNRSKNPILISPAWIGSFVAIVGINGKFFFSRSPALPPSAVSASDEQGEMHSEIRMTRDRAVFASAMCSLPRAYPDMCVFACVWGSARLYSPERTFSTPRHVVQSETHNHTMPLELLHLKSSFYITHPVVATWQRWAPASVQN